ncbi:hypothetical protein [Kitasatospora sp. NPDC088134]|uniref:hypothetical protein n=1 Tax=Kitasatospora sp. NPDC088134 TaxID=3364071 RepID=UPI00381531C5
MRNHITPAALGLAMLLAGSPWQTHNWGGGVAAGILAALAAHWARQVPGLVKRAMYGPAQAAEPEPLTIEPEPEAVAPAPAPAPVSAYDRDRAEIPTRRRNRRR